MSELTPIDRQHLRRSIELALTAREAGDEPFGAVLADADGNALYEHLNTENNDADPSAHAELNLLRHLPARLRGRALAGTTMYASGEPCPMCATLIYQCGVDRIIFAVSGARFRELTGDSGANHLGLTCADIMYSGSRTVEVIGPVPESDGESVFQ